MNEHHEDEHDEGPGVMGIVLLSAGVAFACLAAAVIAYLQ